MGTKINKQNEESYRENWFNKDSIKKYQEHRESEYEDVHEVNSSNNHNWKFSLCAYFALIILYLLQ